MIFMKLKNWLNFKKKSIEIEVLEAEKENEVYKNERQTTFWNYLVSFV